MSVTRILAIKADNDMFICIILYIFINCNDSSIKDLCLVQWLTDLIKKLNVHFFSVAISFILRKRTDPYHLFSGTICKIGDCQIIFAPLYHTEIFRCS